MSEFRTLTEALDARAASDRAVTHVLGPDEARVVTLSGLRARALGVLGHLQRCGLRPGDELVLMLDSSEQFVDALWAALYGGLLPVPLAAGATDEHRRKLIEVLRRLDRPAVLTTRRIAARLRAFAEAEGLTEALDRVKGRLLQVEDIVDVQRPGEVCPRDPSDPAFIQFSSGSTRTPKGVVLTHDNVLANIDGILTASRATEDDVGLSWMPLTHDMGLVGFHLTPVVANIAHTLIPTELFIRRPLIWLERIQRDAATITGAPNFGYAHVLRAFRPDKVEGLDLSRLRLIFNGAEPISAPLVHDFLRTLAPFGLRASAMFPVYGLAEATVAVTAPEAGSGLQTVDVDRERLTVGAPVEARDGGLTMVQHGGPVAHCDLRITDEEDRPVVDGSLGHIQIRGRNVTGAFQGAQDEFRRARTDDGWLRTGDLGFLHAGALVVAGRAKDVIFVHGQNVYPQDIEWTLAQLEDLEPGRVVAAGCPGDAGDEVLVFIVHRGEPQAMLPLAAQARRAIGEHMGIEVAHVLPVRRFPKTTSGKVQRNKLIEAFRAGEFAEAIEAMRVEAPAAGGLGASGADAIALQLQQIVHRVMPETPIGLEDNIFEVGTSSLTLAQIFEEIDRVWPDMMEATDFFDYPTIQEVAGYLESRLAGDGAAS